MAEIVNNKKGFKVLKFSQEETYKLGWGIPDSIRETELDDDTVLIEHVGNKDNKGACLCCHCNNIIKEPIYYSVLLNDTFCKECYNSWIDNPNTIKYDEDKKYEEKSYNNLLKELNLFNINIYNE